MPAEKIDARIACSKLDQMSKRELRAALSALIDGIRVITVKLDTYATAGTDYTAEFDAVVTK